jgi:hypothetical protein
MSLSNTCGMQRETQLANGQVGAVLYLPKVVFVLIVRQVLRLPLISFSCPTTGQQLAECSLYGIRVYKTGAVLAPHVDRMPLVSSAIINVDQDGTLGFVVMVYKDIICLTCVSRFFFAGMFQSTSHGTCKARVVSR